jgi:hypothetical protein
MSNMSYCRMENTYNDLVDCFDNWEETESKSELKYRAKLLGLCREIVDSYEDDVFPMGKEEDEEYF